jgi:hypothetical protein
VKSRSLSARTERTAGRTPRTEKKDDQKIDEKRIKSKGNETKLGTGDLHEGYELSLKNHCLICTQTRKKSNQSQEHEKDTQNPKTAWILMHEWN